MGPGWEKLGHKLAPGGPDWGPFGNAAWEEVRRVHTAGKGNQLRGLKISLGRPAAGPPVYRLHGQG